MLRWLTPIQALLAAPQLALLLAGWLAVRLCPGLARACLPVPEESAYDNFEPACQHIPQSDPRRALFREPLLESWRLN